MYNDKEEMYQKVIIFYIICSVIFILNFVGIIYGIYQDNQFNDVKETIQTLKEEQKTGDILEDTASSCEYGAKQLLVAIKVFVAKILMGAIISALLIIPNMFYNLTEKEIITCLIPDDKTEIIVLLIILLMTLYNVISPILEIEDYVNLLKETESVLSDLKLDELINSFSIY